MSATIREAEYLAGSVGAMPQKAPSLSRWRAHVLRVGILILASYGLLYFTYKFSQPWPGSNDYYANYYFMYLSPVDANAAPAPYILRQVSAVITHLVLATHLYVPNHLAPNTPGRDPHVLFAAMLTNWVFLILAAWLAGLIAEEELKQPNAIVALIAGFLCLLAFQTPFFVISGLTEGVSWFLLAAAFLAYMRRVSLWIVLILAISIIQRESISIIIGVIAACDLALTREDKRLKLQVVGTAVVCFALYFLARRLFFPGSNGETHFSAMLASIQHPVPASTFLTQMVLTQSIAIVFVGVVLFGRHGTHLKRVWLPCVLAAMLALDAIGVAAGIVDNLGRILAILVPVLAGLAAAGLWQVRHRFE